MKTVARSVAGRKKECFLTKSLEKSVPANVPVAMLMLILMNVRMKKSVASEIKISVVGGVMIKMKNGARSAMGVVQYSSYVTSAVM